MSTSNRVLVLDKNKKPLMPCSAARARKLLRDKKAAVYKHYPFTIILKYREGGDVQDVHIGIDPGTKTTGMAMVAHFERGPVCIYGMHIEHRGATVRKLMETRSNSRRSRRSRKLRYRKPRFSNRTDRRNFIAPSIKTRVENVFTWVRRLSSGCNVSKINFEVVKFDTNQLSNISEQQSKTDLRVRTQMRHYLLNLYGSVCQYCFTTRGPFEWDHIHPLSRGGTNAISNSTLACRPCNQDKGKKLLGEWLEELRKSGRSISRLREKGIQLVMIGRKKSIKDAAIMNRTRHLISNGLKEMGYVIEEYPSWETAYNRNQSKVPKDHWIDAALVGCTPEINPVMGIFTAKARQNNPRQMVRPDRFGFTKSKPKSQSQVYGFRSGDLVRLNKPTGRYKGTYVGSIVIRYTGNFDLKLFQSKISAKYSNFKLLQRSDGYRYIKGGGKLTIVLK